MESAPCISQIATLLADPKRSAMLWALMDGSSRPSEELALLVGLSTPSASAHLARLTAGGLLRIEARGRKRFFRMATPEVGAAVEALASASIASVSVLSRGLSVRLSPYRVVPLAPTALWRARLCHDHLGGELAAVLYQQMLDTGWVDCQDLRLEVTPLGVRQLEARGIFVQALARHHRAAVACACSDWSERRFHLSGALGAGLLRLFMQSGWLALANESRALQISAAGLRGIEGFVVQTPLKIAN